MFSLLKLELSAPSKCFGKSLFLNTMKVTTSDYAKTLLGMCRAFLKISSFLGKRYRLYIICAEGSALIEYDEDGSITDCYYDGRAFLMPKFTLSIQDFMEDLRDQDVLADDEMITDVYTEDQISIEVKLFFVWRTANSRSSGMEKQSSRQKKKS